MRKTIHSAQGRLLSETLRQIRERAGLTQRELCRRLGKEHSFVSKYELGERRIDIVEFYWICKACGVSPEVEATQLMKAFAALDRE
ncbi:helix-turn-helix domain-containing protein [Thiohalomonas denitrificans]|uniref:helix-turn-helix domain-containing protein n=1 Tax=Thiohalomonas denitrificans TaxID=415747 RepID=UPI0026E988D4|nr:helix-turn-helix transcriptional regulator [Thiohalomonas denitrificans]